MVSCIGIIPNKYNYTVHFFFKGNQLVVGFNDLVESFKSDFHRAEHISIWVWSLSVILARLSLKMSWKSPQKSSQVKIGNPEVPSSRNLKLDLLPVSGRRHMIFYRWSVRRWNRLKPVITHWFPLLTLNSSLQGAVDKQHESWRENFLFLPYKRKCASFPSGFSHIHCYFNLHKS